MHTCVTRGGPLVVKADGLAAGKGVVVATHRRRRPGDRDAIDDAREAPSATRVRGS